tara:strand:+ start:3165 stop:3356 length:192 start_codon:yes stop_codon:yes gene_type:complete
MIKGYPPVVLVQTWLSILSDNNPKLDQGKHRVDQAIINIFGSVEIAEIYIEQNRKDQITQYIA